MEFRNKRKPQNRVFLRHFLRCCKYEKGVMTLRVLTQDCKSINLAASIFAQRVLFANQCAVRWFCAAVLVMFQLCKDGTIAEPASHKKISSRVVTWTQKTRDCTFSKTRNTNRIPQRAVCGRALWFAIFEDDGWFTFGSFCEELLGTVCTFETLLGDVLVQIHPILACLDNFCLR